MKHPKLLQTEFILHPETPFTLGRLFADKVRGLLEVICPGSKATFDSQSNRLEITHIRTIQGVMLVKAVGVGVAEGMDLTLEATDFGLDD